MIANGNGKNLTLSPRKPIGLVDQDGTETRKSLFTSADLEDLAAIAVYCRQNTQEAGHPEDGEAIALTLEALMSRIITLLPPWELHKVKLLTKDE